MTGGSYSPARWLPAIGLSAVWLAAAAFGGADAAWDRRLLSILHADERDGRVVIAWYATWLGDWLMLVPAGLAGAGFLAWKGRQGDALVLVAGLAAVRILVSVQKGIFERARPAVEPWVAEASYAFPSAHAANSAATCLALAVLLSGSRPAMIAAIGISAAVGTSRVVLGVHWPSDAVGGWAFGALAALVLWRVRGRDRFAGRNGGPATPENSGRPRK